MRRRFGVSPGTTRPPCPIFALAQRLGVVGRIRREAALQNRQGARVAGLPEGPKLQGCGRRRQWASDCT